MNAFTALKAYFFPPKPSTGLIHIECMATMTLGSAIFSPSRMLFRQVAIFAQWENEAAIDNFLLNDSFGRQLAKGWHTRLVFLRQWGKISEFTLPKKTIELENKETEQIGGTFASFF